MSNTRCYYLKIDILFDCAGVHLHNGTDNTIANVEVLAHLGIW